MKMDSWVSALRPCIWFSSLVQQVGLEGLSRCCWGLPGIWEVFKKLLLNWTDSCRGRKSLRVGWFVCWQVGGDQIWGKRIVLGEENCGRNTKWEAEAAIRVIWAWAGRGPLGWSNGAEGGNNGDGRTGRGLKTVCAATQKSSSWKHPLLLDRSCVGYWYSRVPSLTAPCPPQSLPASLSLGSIHWRGRGQTTWWLWWGLPWKSWVDSDEMTIIRSMWRRGQVICLRSVNRLMATLWLC